MIKKEMEAGSEIAKFTIHDLPCSERPRERMQRIGAENLSAQELFALILGRGISGESVMITVQRLLDKFENLDNVAVASIEELSTIKGIGLAKACQIKAAFELANRWDKSTRIKDKHIIKTPEEAYSEFKGKFRGKKKEHFWAIFLDTRNQVIKCSEISVGSLDSSIVHPRELFKEAIASSSSSIIVAHNHPSGNPEASPEDISLTKRLIQAGKIVGIEIVDHLIIGDGKFISLKREELF
jgi:DNA repair protein RadC